MIKSLFTYILALVLIGITILILVNSESLALLGKISVNDLMIALVLVSLICITQGVSISLLIRQQFQKNLHNLDILLLPFMTNFWGFVLPLKGGVLYFMLYLKAKYRVNLTDTAAIEIYLTFINFILIGLFGLWLTLINRAAVSAAAFFSIVLVFSPFILIGLNLLVQSLPLRHIPLAHRIQSLTNSVTSESSRPWKNLPATLLVIGLTVIRFGCTFVWYLTAAMALGLNVPYVSLILLVFATELTKRFRITPGNLGFDELVSGGIFNLLGQNTAEGILLALFWRVSVLLVTFTIGTWGVLRNMKYFQIDNIKALWTRLNTSSITTIT